MTGARPTNPARCLLIVDVGHGRPTRCREPVAWHGSLSSGDGLSYHVWACEGHAEHLDDAMPITQRVDATDATTDRVVMLSWK